MFAYFSVVMVVRLVQKVIQQIPIILEIEQPQRDVPGVKYGEQLLLDVIDHLFLLRGGQIEGNRESPEERVFRLDRYFLELVVIQDLLHNLHVRCIFVFGQLEACKGLQSRL